MQCDVRGMTDAAEASRTPTENLPRPGRVTEVCREWLVHEDGALAYRLQNEEIEHHYTGNKFRNALVRQDIPCAKDEQRREEQEAATVQALYDQMIREQEEIDAQVAKQLADKIEREEFEKRVAAEQRDKDIARQMQERERLRLERLREERDQRVGAAMYIEPAPEPTAGIAVRHRDERYMGRASVEPEGAHATYYEDALARDLRRSSLAEVGSVHHKPAAAAAAAAATAGPSSDPLSDLSDFCLQPDPNMSEEEARFFQEEQDAELARLLQEQEVKRRGDSMVDRDRVMAVEAQDHEFARMLQDKEKAKAKRARERARQRALLKKQQREVDGRDQAERGEEDGEESISPTNTPSGDWPEHTHSRPAEIDMRVQPKGTGKPRCPDPPSTLTNIAMVIDPTYGQRANSGMQPQQQVQTVVDSSLPAAESVSVAASPAISLPPPDFDEDELNSIPPYMPIQGQRRSASLEKKGKKPKAKKEPKDGCKQQ